MDAVGAASLAAWTPVRVRTAGNEPVVDWAILERYAEPFFEQSADRAMQHPFNQVFGRHTSLAAVEEVAARSPGVAPAGFVFHMSRCGSTLVAQMLAALPATIVLSEAQPLDALIGLHRRRPDLDEATLVRYLRAMVGALAQPRAGETRLFVKFNAWHVLELPLIARAFPEVPWAFVFREPRAVLRSQSSNRGPETIAGTLDPAWFGLTAAEAAALSADEYGARVIAGFAEAALRHKGLGRGAFVEYADLPAAVPARLFPHFGVAAGEAEAAASLAVAGADAKGPILAGAPGGDEDDLAARWLDAPYAALRGAR
jgi:hypothetical protein